MHVQPERFLNFLFIISLSSKKYLMHTILFSKKNYLFFLFDKKPILHKKLAQYFSCLSFLLAGLQVFRIRKQEAVVWVSEKE